VSTWDPSLGLEKPRELIATVGADEGIEITGDIGVTSHAGDLLRRAAIPSRLVGSASGRHAGD
jgi:predicted methyltransferase MtxX (methanogen marker protein 4)